MTNDSASKKVIAIDFDDVVMNFHASFANFNNQRYGTKLTYEDLTRYDDWEILYGCDKETLMGRAKVFYKSPEHMSVLPVIGAVEAISQLAPLYSLQIVTSRPDSIRERTVSWLNQHFPGMFQDFHFTNIYAGALDTKPKKKSEVCQEIGAVVMIDDAIRHVMDVAEHGITALLPDRPWNREFTPAGVQRMHSWQEIAEWIKKNV